MNPAPLPLQPVGDGWNWTETLWWGDGYMDDWPDDWVRSPPGAA